MKFESVFKGYDRFKDAVLVTTPELSVIYCNPAFKRLICINESTPCPNFDKLIDIISEHSGEREGIRHVLTQLCSNPEWNGSHSLLFEGISLHINSTPFPVSDDGMMGRIWMFSETYPTIHTDEQFIQSEKLFRMVFDLIPEGIAISDLKTGKFFEVNEHFSRWWGYSRDEVIGKSAVEMDFWVDINERNDIVDRLQRYGYFHLIPVRMRGKDKKIKQILFSGRIITINNRPFMLSIPIDVTNIRQYEEKIWSLASFIELNPNPVLEINESGIITMNNEAAMKTITHLTGSPDLHQFLPDGLDEILDAIWTGKETSFVREVTIHDRIFLEYIYITNQYRTARMYLTDITDRKKVEFELLRKNEELAAAYEEITSTEEELRQNYDKLVLQEQELLENQKKLRMIVDHIPGIVLTTDTGLHVKSIFGAGLEKIGLLPNEGLGKKIENFFPHADTGMVQAHYQALKGMEYSIETHYGDRDVHLYVSPIRDRSENITGTMGIAIDVTEQKTLEKERKSLLIQLEQNLVELAILNDKIRNPLTVIATLIDMHAPHIEKQINQSIRDIDDIITNLDKRWMESEKTINFLQKHYGFGNWEPDNLS